MSHRLELVSIEGSQYRRQDFGLAENLLERYKNVGSLVDDELDLILQINSHNEKTTRTFNPSYLPLSRFLALTRMSLLAIVAGVAMHSTVVSGHGYLSSPMSRTGLNAEVWPLTWLWNAHTRALMLT